MFVSLIFSIIFLVPYTLQADYATDSEEDVIKTRQRFPKVRTNNHIRSSELHKHHKHRTKNVDYYSSEERSEECRCTCENCTEKSCCDKDICGQCILQQSSVMLIPYNYPYMMPQYNMNIGAQIPANVSGTTEAATTTVTQRAAASLTTTSFKAEEMIAQSPSSFYKPEERIESSLYNRRQDSIAEQEIIRNYILGKIQEEKQNAEKQMQEETVRDLQKTQPRRVDKSIFKAGGRSADEDDERGYPYEDVERLLQYVKSVRKEKLRPDMKDIQG